jgi:hypothetical protein
LFVFKLKTFLVKNLPAPIAIGAKPVRFKLIIFQIASSKSPSVKTSQILKDLVGFNIFQNLPAYNFVTLSIASRKSPSLLQSEILK